MMTQGAVAPVAVVVNSATPLWYLTRATGLVALVLLTGSMALGLLSSVRYQRPALPRFVVAGLHRNLSLLAIAFTIAHIVTTLADSFVPIGLRDVVIPFLSAYRPLWLGLGTLAFDLMIALTLTSLLRARISYRSWRLVHWASYLCWPVAVLHGLGTGTDTPVDWVLGLTVACVAVVTVLTGWRLAYGWPAHAFARLTGALAVVLALIAGAAWLAAGPLHPGWSRRAGTPPSLLTGHAAGARHPASTTGHDSTAGHIGTAGLTSTVPASTVPASTVPASMAPASTRPASTGAASSGPASRDPFRHGPAGLGSRAPGTAASPGESR